MNSPVDLGAPLALGPLKIRNRVLLAPMSGISDEAFRALAHRHGAGLVVSEMVASGELAKGRAESARRIRRPDVDVHMVQLAGRDAIAMAQAARIAADEGADIIDINMGCPAKKVTGGYAGSALMREPDHALTLIEAVVGAVDVPVTLKMRLGWDGEALNAPYLARRAEGAGIAMVTVHGRTRCQFYQGRADWRAIARVKQAVSIPVVANGDVGSAAEAREALASSGADAVMIGRASYGAPWAPAAIAHEAGGAPALGVPQSAVARSDYAIAHYQAMLGLYGVESGLRQARKHLGWYLDRFCPRLPAERRRAVLTGDAPNAVIAALSQALLEGAGAAEERRAA